MDLIVNEVVEFKVIHIAYRNSVVKLLSGASVIKNCLSVLRQTCFTEALADISLVRAVEYRCHDLPAELLCGHAEVDLKHLTDIHTGRNAERVQADIKRCSVLEERHILLRQYTGNNALVSMAARHLIADRDLTLLCDIAADKLIYSGRKLIAVLSCKDLNVNDNTGFSVRNFKRAVSYLSCLFTEDRAEESFLSCQLGFALWCDLADQNIARSYLCAYSYDTVLVEVFQSVLGNVGDISCDLLCAELGITALQLVFLDMNGRILVLLNKVFVEQYGVLIVIALPCHKADESVLSEGNFSVAGRRSVGNDLMLFYSFALVNDRALVCAGSRIGALELDKIIGMQRAAVLPYDDLIGTYALNNAGGCGNDRNAGVEAGLIFHTGSDDRGLGFEKRNSLSLHI